MSVVIFDVYTADTIGWLKNEQSSDNYRLKCQNLQNEWQMRQKELFTYYYRELLQKKQEIYNSEIIIRHYPTNN